LYQLRHRLCPVCDTVLSAHMRYCPHCGARQQDETKG
ncbi:MAG: zinc-ribbon domain-containing protein, partial [Candidatus Fimadaptatus sp.]